MKGILDSWKHRRRLVFLVIVFCLFGIGYLVFFGSDIRLHETALSGFFSLLGAVCLGYVFGAIWDDKNKKIRG